MRNTEIADALSELGTLYELDGAIRYRVLAYREAARVIRESPVSVAELARAGTRNRAPRRSARRCRRRSSPWSTTGEIPSAAKLKREVPGVPGRGDPGPRASARRRPAGSTTSSASQTWTTCARRPRRSASAASRAWARRLEENVLAALEQARRPRDRRSGGCSRRCSPIAERARGGASRANPASDAVEVAGSARRRGGDLQGRRPDRDRRPIRRRSPGAARAPARRRERRSAGEAGARGSSPTTASRSTCGSSRPRRTGTCSSTSPAPPSTTSKLRERAVGDGPLGLRARDRRDAESGEIATCATEAEVYERLGLPYIEPELREGERRDRAAAEGAARAGRPSTTSAATCTATRPSPTASNTLEEMAAAARDRGYAYLAVTDHSASHGFGNDVTSPSAGAADRGGPRARTRGSGI